MGTRHLICVFHNGAWVIVQYGQWDGSPEFQGNQVLEFLSVKGNIDRLKAGLAHIYRPAEDEINQIYKQANELQQAYRLRGDFHRANNSLNALKPSLSRDAGANILSLVAGATTENPIPVQISWEDGDILEWFYVIDLDTEVLEVFRGWLLDDYGDRPDAAATIPHRRFEGVNLGGEPHLLKSYPLADLPSRFEGCDWKEFCGVETDENQ